MDRTGFDDYVRRFNAEDVSAFRMYLAPEVTAQNGSLHFRGVQGMIDHYAKIWGRFRLFLPGERTGKFRYGKDDLLFDSAGRSGISMEDFAIAMLDELETPRYVRQRFTVGY